MDYRLGLTRALNRCLMCPKVRSMAKLVYAMVMSLDGYTEDEQGHFGWGVAGDEELHIDICKLVSPFGTYLLGRRMYEKMVYWETSHTIPGQPQYLLDFARQWQAADKIVYSKTLAEPRSARTKIERSFDPDAVRQLKANAGLDIAVSGPELASQAIHAGLVDEFLMIVCPAVDGGGKRFFPNGVRLDLDLVEQRLFPKGVTVLRYAVRGQSK
jgi:dihydrofolate reductase